MIYKTRRREGKGEWRMSPIRAGHPRETRLCSRTYQKRPSAQKSERLNAKRLSIVRRCNFQRLFPSVCDVKRRHSHRNQRHKNDWSHPKRSASVSRIELTQSLMTGSGRALSSSFLLEFRSKSLVARVGSTFKTTKRICITSSIS